jgi:hypothetical protein
MPRLQVTNSGRSESHDSDVRIERTSELAFRTSPAIMAADNYLCAPHPRRVPGAVRGGDGVGRRVR